MKTVYKILKTPVGEMRAAANDNGLCIFDFVYRKMMSEIISRVERYKGEEMEQGEHPYIDLAEKQMEEYFRGERKEFDIPLDLNGTDFQIRVWKGLIDIPYGDTRSYKEQSIYLGDEKAIRAVARANGENGLAIIVPCHRVIGTNGSLIGYGGGLWRKKWLLEHEWKHSGKAQQLTLVLE